MNDISGAKEEKMIETVKRHSAGLIVSHRNQNSSSIHEKINYKDVVRNVKKDLRFQVKNFLDRGVNKNQVAIDLGLGFAKTQEESAVLLESVGEFVGDYPLVVGYSRKKFTSLLQASEDELLTYCQNQGVSLVRLHFID